MTACVLRGDARHLPLPDGCVDLIVTSPPYFGLRSYTDGGAHYAGQIGSEPTSAAWLDALLECTREWVRVLKPEGNLFVNLGDKYANSPPSLTSERVTGLQGGRAFRSSRDRTKRAFGVPTKSLLGLPWRYAIGCMDRLGLILRAEIIWAKPNGLPESVTDRVRRAHEQVFHFTRQPRYYAAVDKIREPHSRSWGGSPNGGHTYGTMKAPGEKDANLPTAMPNPLGKLPGSVWDIPSSPLQVPERVGVDHFAAFPPALVRPIVLGWSPPGVCTACGHGRRPVVDTWREVSRPVTNYTYGGPGRKPYMGDRGAQTAAIFGYACACPEGRVTPGCELGDPCHQETCPACCPDLFMPAPTRPAVVLDPFGGTGTTALVASAYGRVGVTVDLSADYCRLAQWRVNDPGERARARAMPKPPPVPDGMEPLFTM
jgi:DNA modification methylase